jgi:predicted component of type VI protein secretion system
VSEESLRELLARVHDRLGQSGSVDPQSRELLVMVMRDIDRALGTDAGADDVKVATLPRLEALAVRFEAEHPAVAQLLRQIGTLLGQAGL